MWTGCEVRNYRNADEYTPSLLKTNIYYNCHLGVLIADFNLMVYFQMLKDKLLASEPKSPTSKSHLPY